MNTSSLRSRIRQRCLRSPLPFNNVLETLHTAIRQETEIKNIHIGKRERNVITDGTIIFIENPKESTRRLLKLTGEFSKVARYKKSIIFLYSSNKKLKIEIRIPSIISKK